MPLKRFLCLAIATLVLADGNAAVPQPPTLQLSECITEKLMTAGARCGWLRVAENPADASGRAIELRVTVIPSLRIKPQPDPLVILAGGPGQSAHDVYAQAALAFSGIRRDRDILLIDQRGTGRSNRLGCEFDDGSGIESTDPQQLRVLGQRCLAALHGDPRFYTTSVAVRDLEAVRAALGYEQFSFYAGSYGTRVAQHYLRRYPSRTRAMILDGVVPVDLALGPDIAPRAQQALDALFDRCSADPACDSAFPRIRTQFATLSTSIGREPLQVRVSDPVTARLRDATFGQQQLNAAVRLLTYSDETASLLPLLINEAQSGAEPQPLIAQYLMIRRMTDQLFAYGMHFAVVCSEDAPRWTGQDVPAQTLAATYMGTGFMEGMKAVCDGWPRGLVDEDFNAPLQSDVPVLLLSGGNDPVTPAIYGERTLASFRNGRHLVLRGQGHGQLTTSCVPRLAAQFIASGSAAALDTKCLDEVSPAPFMLSRTGAGP